METQVPETFDDLNDEQLTELEESLVNEFDAAFDNDGSMELLGELAEAIDKTRSTKQERSIQAEENAAKRAELAERIRPNAEDGTDEDGAEAATDEADPDANVEDADADASAPSDDAVEKEPELVTASATNKRPPSARKVAGRQTAPTAPTSAASEIVITASADVPGYSNGQQIDRHGIAQAMHARARGMGDSKGRQTVFNVATVNRPIPEAHWIRDGNDNAADVMTAAVNDALAGKDANALVASGGFCAPSEIMYDLFSVESRDGLIDLPTVGVSRGGVQVPNYIGLGDVAAGVWAWTEANDITPGSDGPATKPCITVPCPGFTDVRLTAEGLCVTAGNLTDRAYPELTARTVDLAMTAHLHQMSTAKIAAIVASATSVTVTAVPSDAAGDILNAVDLQVSDYRSQHLLGEGTVLDAVLPHWFFGAIRATLAMRAGVSELAVSDQRVREFFTIRNLRPQFVYGYDALFDTTPATGWPTTATMLLFPTGGYVAGDGGTIDLGVVRDSTLNATNDFTAAWAESFYSVMQRGPAAREVTMTTLINGITGGPAAVPVAA